MYVAMSTVTLVFGRSHSPISWAIRFFTWSPWSHVAVAYDGRVIESQAPRGVQSGTEMAMRARYSETATVEFHHPDPDALIAAMRSQLGKPYDYGAIVGFIFRRDWASPKRWFCSELVAWAFSATGRPLFRSNEMDRVTPGHIWMLTGN